MIEILTQDFMIRAILAGAMMAIVAPVIGSFLVIRRYSLIADTLSHVALLGVAIGMILRTAPMIATVAVTVGAGVMIEVMRRKGKVAGETILGMFLPGGLALALILMSLARGFNANLFSYLFGSIATVGVGEVGWMALLTVVTLVILGKMYKQLLFASLDEESAKVSGVATERVGMILVILTAVTVAMAMRVVGAMLVGALMVIPVVTARLVARSFKASVVGGVAVAMMAVMGGIVMSYYLDLPAGAAIVMAALGLYVIAAGVRKIK